MREETKSLIRSLVEWLSDGEKLLRRLLTAAQVEEVDSSDVDCKLRGLLAVIGEKNTEIARQQRLNIEARIMLAGLTGKSTADIQDILIKKCHIAVTEIGNKN